MLFVSSAWGVKFLIFLQWLDQGSMALSASGTKNANTKWLTSLRWSATNYQEWHFSLKTNCLWEDDGGCCFQKGKKKKKKQLPLLKERSSSNRIFFIRLFFLTIWLFQWLLLHSSFSLGDARLFQNHLLVYLGIKGVLMNFDYPKVLQSVPRGSSCFELNLFCPVLSYVWAQRF